MDVAQEPKGAPPSGAVRNLIPHVYRELHTRGPQTAAQLAAVFEVGEARIIKALAELRNQGIVRQVGHGPGRPPANAPYRVAEPRRTPAPENPRRPPPVPAVRISEWENMTATLDDLEQAGVIPTSDVGWGNKMKTIRTAVAELLECRQAEIDLIKQIAALVRERDEARAMAGAQ